MKARATARFFSNYGVETRDVMVDSDGTVWVYSDIAGYTLCHALSARTQRRIVKEVRAANSR